MTTASDRPRTALVSGHIDLTQQEFDRIYMPQIDAALAAGDHFIVGDAVGVDASALTYLLSPAVTDIHVSIGERITVYASREHNVSRLRGLGIEVIAPSDPALAVTPEVEILIGVGNEGRDKARFRHLIRDTHMTLNSDYDILYVRSDEESRRLYGDKYRARTSATEYNRRRREAVAAQRERSS